MRKLWKAPLFALGLFGCLVDSAHSAPPPAPTTVSVKGVDTDGAPIVVPSVLLGCQFLTSPPTLTSTWKSPIQCNNKGQILLASDATLTAMAASETTIATNSGTSNTSLTTIATNSGTSNTSLSTIATNTGTISTNSGTSNTSLSTLVTDFGAPGATACAGDTTSCNQNQQLQRIAQRITSLITALGTPFQAGASIGNTAFTANAGTNLNTSLLALETGGNLAASKADLDIVAANAVPQTGNGFSFCYAAIKTTVTACGTQATSHNIVHISGGNEDNTVVSYLQFFNTAIGSVTLGTTPPVFVVPLPANGGRELNIDMPGRTMSADISMACTTTATGSTAPTNNCQVTVDYK